ncbi:DUF262 domain-containing protein [Sphingomonas sp. CFBP 13714]|uniref:DUF262 domain-containing protein n=1 Tax=Sphingomonas sp. CFBP 13714 TaxID=2775308 RepID=UPI00177B0D86|nr:DUF262 domain-containing protein [Sphingomonas sp. CFBP 13714]MBD8699724.1 DUF262 domain-containing protein [Sphingomonas sp. CFBP 13714]
MIDLFLQDHDDPSDENLEDLHIGARSLASAVVYNTDWTVETLTRQVEKGAIDLTPNFQRRDAWNKTKKSLLIESILLNFPVPPLTLAEVGDSKRFIVVDGKQRLTTLCQFFGLMPSSPNNEFRLSGLAELDEINGLNRRDIEENRPAMFRALENYTVRTNVIRGWKKDDVLYSIFLRLNSGSVKLSPQELRQALNPGPFTEWLSIYTADSAALRSIFSNTEPDFRMRDVELMIRYLAMQFFLPNYRGDLKQFLDGTARVINVSWSAYEDRISHQAALFEKAYDAVISVFGSDHAMRKWNGQKWEGRLNRAVFDIMMFYLDSDDKIARFVESGEKLVQEFKSLCDGHSGFRESIESTTKSVEAVGNRLGLWGHTLAEFGVVSEYVTLTDNGLTFRDA